MEFWNGWTGLENNATKEIENYSDLSIMFICGDWNAYTNMRTQPVTCHKTCRICGVMQNRSSIIDLNLVWPCTNFSTLEYFESPRSICTVPLRKSKLFISRSCPILVLTTVLIRPRQADIKNSVKNYQGPPTFWENAIRK
jgi:hypothetical protein